MLSQAGIFVESHSAMEDFKLVKDKLTVVAGAILEVLKDDYRFNHSDDGKTIKVICKIEARVDTSKINLKDLISKEQLLETIREKDKQIEELLKRAPTDANQRLFMIAKYERELDVFNLNRKLNWSALMDTAQKLSSLDSQNSTAFRATAMYYRNNEDMRTVADYCEKVLASSKTPLLSIEALSQLGDIYFNEFNDKATARKYVDRAIALAKKTYSRNEIEELVNGTDVELVDMRLMGKTNSIRELYILKSDLEDCTPEFESLIVMDNLELMEYKIYNIKHRTDW